MKHKVWFNLVVVCGLLAAFSVARPTAQAGSRFLPGVRGGEQAAVRSSPVLDGFADWPQQGFDPQRTSYNPHEVLLGRENVGELAVLWSRSTPCTVNDGVTVADGVVYYGHYCGEFLAVDADTGATVWTQPINTTATGSAVVDGVVYVAARCTYTYCGGVYAFDATSGSPLWTWNTGSEHVGFPVVSGGVLYVSANNATAQTTYALDATTGAELWSATPGGIPAVGDGVVYASSYKNAEKLVALDPATGDLLWTGLVGGTRVLMPVVATGYVFAHSDDGRLYAFAAGGCGQDECPPDWVASLQPDPVNNPQPPAAAEGIVYVGSGSALYAFAAGGCGEPECPPVWHTPTACGFFANINTPSVANGVVYSACDNNYLYAFDAATGEVLWSYYTSGGDQMRASPAIAGGRVYHAATFDFTLYAFEPPISYTMHVGGIEGYFSLDPFGRTLLRIRVLVEDQAAQPLGEVQVDASIMAPCGGPFARTRVTKPSGYARFHWGCSAGGAWELCVDNLTREGYTYQPGDNVVTCQEWQN